MITKTVYSIDVNEFNKLVKDTYGRPYDFQQQDGCQDRGIECFTVPDPHAYDFENDSVPEKVNGDDRGVSFKAWLERHPTQKLNAVDDWDREHGLELFWHRNFYPSLEMVTNDLHARGLIPIGDYHIVIDW